MANSKDTSSDKRYDRVLAIVTPHIIDISAENGFDLSSQSRVASLTLRFSPIDSNVETMGYAEGLQAAFKAFGVPVSLSVELSNTPEEGPNITLRADRSHLDVLQDVALAVQTQRLKTPRI